MTTIVYRDGVLAADTSASMDGILVPESDRKVHRLRDGRLFAWCGDAGHHIAVLAHFNGERKSLPEKVDGVAIVVGTNGKVWTLESGEMVPTRRAPYIARGTGKHLAYGALAMGASARHAVKIAGRFDQHTNGRVESVSLRRDRKR